MKSKSIHAWAVVVAFLLFVVAAPMASASTDGGSRSVQLVKQSKGDRVVVDQADDSGTPEIQFGDPDDLGGGDGKTRPEPPIGNPGGEENSGLEWHQAIYEYFKSLMTTLL